MTTVSVIVPTFNGAHRLPFLLNSLAQQIFQDFELVVVVDGSTDNSHQVLKRFNSVFKNFKIVIQTNKGRAGARNSGALAANGSIFIFVDDDVKLSPETIQSHVEHHKKERSSVLVGSIVEEEGERSTDVQKYRRKLSIKWQSALGITQTKIQEPYLSAANFSIEKTTFDQLNGFDERLKDCEDHDLAIRIQAKGLSIYFDPGIISWHLDSITAWSYLRRLKDYKKAYLNLCSRYGWQKEPSSTKFPKRVAYWLLSFPFWIHYIDTHMLIWLPEKIRYKLYDAIFFSQSEVFPR